MNELELLREHRDSQPGPTPTAVAKARSRLTGRRALPRRRFALAAAGVAAATATVLVAPALLGGDKAEPVYAVKPMPTGVIKVTLREFADSAGLRRRLNELGLSAVVIYLPQGTQCAEERPNPDATMRNHFGLIEPPSGKATWPDKHWGDRIFRIHTKRIKPGQTLVWIMYFDSGPRAMQGLDRDPQSLEMSWYLTRSPVDPCNRTIQRYIPKR